MAQHRFSRRDFLLGGGTVVVLGGGGAVAISRLISDGSPPPPNFPHLEPGPLVSGSFRSRYRHQQVGWTISYPPRHVPGDSLPVALVLHGYDANHLTAFSSLRLQLAQGELINGASIPPIVLAAADGGNTYWHRRGDGDDPLAMLVEEFLPLLRHRGLLVDRVGALGWSMGGYGALLLAASHPGLVRRVAAESPAIWPSYAASQGANPTAFDSEADWRENDVIARVRQFRSIPTRIDCGKSDPFRPGSIELQQLLPAGSVHLEPGGHDASFWQARGPAQLAFLTS